VAAADLDQGICPPLLRAPGVFPIARPGFGQRPNGGQHHLAGFGIQVAVDSHHARPSGRQAEAASLEGLPSIGERPVGVGQPAPMRQRQREHPRRQRPSLRDEQGLVPGKEFGGEVPGVGQQPHPALRQAALGKRPAGVVHVPQGEGNPQPAPAHRRRFTRGCNEPGGRRTEPLGLRQPAAMGGGDNLGRPSLGSGDEAAETLQFRHNFAVGQPVDRHSLDLVEVAQRLSLEGHTSTHQPGVTTPLGARPPKATCGASA
jgi:hypothetical protein